VAVGHEPVSSHLRRGAPQLLSQRPNEVRARDDAHRLAVVHDGVPLISLEYTRRRTSRAGVSSVTIKAPGDITVFTFRCCSWIPGARSKPSANISSQCACRSVYLRAGVPSLLSLIIPTMAPLSSTTGMPLICRRVISFTASSREVSGCTHGHVARHQVASGEGCLVQHWDYLSIWPNTGKIAKFSEAQG
jgi:hypothetical protein